MARTVRKTKTDYALEANPYRDLTARQSMKVYFTDYRPNAQIQALIVAHENPTHFTVDELHSLMKAVEKQQSMAYGIHLKHPTELTLHKVYLIDNILEKL